MHLELLQVNQVRNLTAVTISPGPNLNILSGPNASGKTAMLESIYLLARARSFRTSRIQDIVQHGSKVLQVRSELLQEKQGKINTGIEKGLGESKIRCNGETIKSVSEQARNIPLVLLTPDSHIIITGGPIQRRHWLDWAMFHVEPYYLYNWKQYFRALKHRNTLLKRGVGDREFYLGWEHTMVKTAAVLQKSRADFIQVLSKTVNQLASDFFLANTTIKLNSGWSNGIDFDASLKGTWDMDRKNGFTGTGPHRADIKILIENKRLSSFFSRGQIKLFVCILILAEAKTLYSKTGVKPVVLLDDFNAELAPIFSEYILTLLNNENFQIFLTTTNIHLMQLSTECCHWFHVKQGKVLPASQ